MMADAKHLAILRRGWKAWNQWRNENGHIKPDLSGLDVIQCVEWVARSVEFGLAGFRDVDFSHANLNGLRLNGCSLRGANLTGANLEHIDLKSATLTNTILVSARLARAVLTGAHLEGANLRGAECWDADLRWSTLAGADFTDAKLLRATLAAADLRGVTFVRTNLASANFAGANLSGANLSEAFIADTVFGNNDLSRVGGLDAVRHGGPSTIGVDTIYRSNGNISEPFLRGCGAPDALITYARSLINHPTQFYSCFISYSTRDQEFADRLHADLQANRVRCWFAPHDIKAGKKLQEQIDEAIQIYDRLALILSDASMSSEWVKTEIAHARQKELREQRQVLFPIGLVPFARIREWKCFDADTGKDSAREIREYFIPDFSNWKDTDSYQKAFQRLLTDLKLEEKTKAASPDRASRL